MQTCTQEEISLSEKDFRKISQLVYDHCGINLHTGKKELVRARLAKRLRLAKFSTFQEYLDNVLNDSTGLEFSILIDSLSTNLTSFWREPQHFEFLLDRFLPNLIDRKRKKGNFRIRAWSAGCSSGEEPYSMAIVLLDALQGAGRWDIKLLASDISTTVLEVAKTGIYSEEKVKKLPCTQRHRYLIPRRSNGEKIFEVGKQLRDIVVFRYLNLMKSWPVKGPLDFIFCRNVMIYFDKSTQQRLVNHFWEVLDTGGILFSGHSESLTGIAHKFKYVQPTIYMKP